jgi:FMN phosphatase YigB (HAD superfamily)
MSLTILFDLDDTLLSNKIEEFLPVYIQSLATAASQVSPKRFISALLAASDEMVRKSHIKGTLESTFDAHFYPAIGFSKSEMRETIDSFYQNGYPSLKKVTHPFPDAQNVVNHLLKDGHQIVVATNPLFPQTAISQRLDWAGFEQTKINFKIITSFENFHFAKPHPEYYAEILAQLGWPDQPAVMIGNSFNDDIKPSEMAGLFAFYLVEESSSQPYTLTYPLSTHGKMSDIPGWLNQIASEVSRFPALTYQGMKAALNVTPAAVDTLVKLIPPGAYPQAITAIKNAITFDYQMGNFQGTILNNLDSIQAASDAFFEARQLLNNLSSDSNTNINKEELFVHDKALLRFLISLRS